MTKANTTKTTSVDKLASPYADYHFSEGDHVTVNWLEGEGPWDQISGIVDELDSFQTLRHEIIPVTNYDDPDWEQGRRYDCAPEWIVVDDD